eukprot:SAG31_NODE_44432_length_263_cov_0.524390_1_plen_39_part_10
MLLVPWLLLVYVCCFSCRAANSTSAGLAIAASPAQVDDA